MCGLESPQRNPSDDALPLVGSPATRKRVPPVDMTEKPIQKEIWEVNCGTQKELGSAPMLIRAHVAKSPFIGKTKKDEPWYQVQLTSLEDNPVSVLYSLPLHIDLQDPSPTGTTYKDKFRLVAFARDATRTVENFAEGDVIDIINPTVAKTREEFVKDQTVIYELRVNPQTKIELFRQDPSSCPQTYVRFSTMHYFIIRCSVADVLRTKPGAKNSVNITAEITHAGPAISYNGS